MKEKDLINRHGLLLYLYRGWKAFRSHDFNFWDNVNYIDPYKDIILTDAYIQTNDDSQNETAYLIYENTPSAGFFAAMFFIIDKLIYADEMGLTPVVELGPAFAYWDENMNPNAWHNYFEPLGSEQTIAAADRVVRQTIGHVRYVKNMYKDDLYTEKVISTVRKNIRIKAELKQEYDEKWNALTQGKKRVLGVHFRGSDYKMNYKNHPTFVGIDDYIKLISEIESNYDLIFLATDDSEAMDKMQECFGDKIVFFDDVTRTDGLTSVIYMQDKKNTSNYRLGYEVLRDCYALSSCDSLVGGCSAVVKFARLLKQSRDEAYIENIVIDKGINVDGKIWG